MSNMAPTVPSQRQNCCSAFAVNSAGPGNVGAVKPAEPDAAARASDVPFWAAYAATA